jgi:hypothetical protein
MATATAVSADVTVHLSYPGRVHCRAYWPVGSALNTTAWPANLTTSPFLVNVTRGGDNFTVEVEGLWPGRAYTIYCYGRSYEELPVPNGNSIAVTLARSRVVQAPDAVYITAEEDLRQVRTECALWVCRPHRLFIHLYPDETRLHYRYVDYRDSIYHCVSDYLE